MSLMKRNETRHYRCSVCDLTVRLDKTGDVLPSYTADVIVNGAVIITLYHAGYFVGMLYKILEWHVCTGELRQTVST